MEKKHRDSVVCVNPPGSPLRLLSRTDSVSCEVFIYLQVHVTGSFWGGVKKGGVVQVVGGCPALNQAEILLDLFS